MTGMRLLFCGLILLWLAGCATTGQQTGGNNAPIDTNVDLSSIPPAIPKDEPLARRGNPASYTVFGKTYHTLKSARGFTQTGTASWYGKPFHGRTTSDGETYNMYRMTAAHKTLPLPTYLRVTNLDNGRHVIVRVNDRGPFVGNRIIDLSYVAALKLRMVRHGTAHVRIETVTAGDVTPADDTEQPGQTQTAASGTAYRNKAGTSDAPEVKALDTADTDPPAEPEASQPSASATGVSAMQDESRPHATSDAASRYLQVGAFSQQDNAKRMSGHLQAMGLHDIQITPAQHDEKTLYRVRIGPIADHDQEQNLRDNLRSEGIPAVPVRAVSHVEEM